MVQPTSSPSRHGHRAGPTASDTANSTATSPSRRPITAGPRPAGVAPRRSPGRHRASTSSAPRPAAPSGQAGQRPVVDELGGARRLTIGLAVQHQQVGTTGQHGLDRQAPVGWNAEFRCKIAIPGEAQKLVEQAALARCPTIGLQDGGQARPAAPAARWPDVASRMSATSAIPSAWRPSATATRPITASESSSDAAHGTSRIGTPAIRTRRLTPAWASRSKITRSGRRSRIASTRARTAATWRARSASTEIRGS